MATAVVDVPTARRKRESIPLRSFGFWTEYNRHPLFRVSVLGEGAREPFVYDVRAFGNMVASVRAFAECAGRTSLLTAGLADIYRTGYGVVNGYQIRVTPLS
jgi:hypothetical protein